MIRALIALAQQLAEQAPPGQALREQMLQSVGFQVMRTGAGDQRAAVCHQLQAQIVDPPVGRKPLGSVFAALDEGRRIKADKIKAASGVTQFGKQGQCVAVQAFYPGVGRCAPQVGRSGVQGGGGGVQEGDFARAALGGHDAESAGIAEGG